MKKHYSLLLILKKETECMSRFCTILTTPDLARQSRTFYGMHANLTPSLVAYIFLVQFLSSTFL